MKVKHTTSVQAADDPTKSVNAAEWNANHFLSGAVSVGALSASVSVLQASLSNLTSAHNFLSNVVSAMGGASATPTSAQFTSLQANVSGLSVLVSTNAAQVSTLSVAVSVVQASLSSLSVEVSVVKAGLSNELSARALSVNNLSAIVSTNLAQLSSLSVAVSIVQAQVSALSVEVSAVKAGLSNELSARALSINNLSAIVSTNLAQLSALSVALSIDRANLSSLSVELSVVRAGLSNELSARALSVDNLSAIVSTNLAQLSALSIEHTSTATLATATWNQLISLGLGKKLVGNAQIISISTPTDVSGMALSVSAGNSYQFKYYIIYQSASPASGLGLTITYPGMITIASVADIMSGPDGTGSWFSGAITSSGDRVQAISCPTSATDYFATLEGACTVSTTGSIQLQAFPEVSGAANQILIQQGTVARIWRR